ncbi:GntR family transcriptional regulator [Pusillimonas sp. MFBS29]|uniref:GntR family transcriptional regulator n=1 Tax=Pusillimonas sp. MFBS29 TaxID=2886690 RepID=UPI001D115F37|nr:GntR family transcriptional regulator [Pusillimonas sp. MFBS29]MCC2595363.1 GntR family transcriptional regulator [Pusillimonas sp. MFBS29]
MKSKRSAVALAIRKQILSGQWRAGSRLPERMLCEFTGAGRQSVREALQILLRDGYVTNEPNRGFRVASLDAAEAADIYQVRSVLEGLAAQNFINLASEAERAALEAALGTLENAINREDIEAQLQAVELFYDVLLSACYNKILKSTLENLHGKISRLRAVSILGPGRMRQAIKEMRRIGDAIKDSNEQEAFQACVDHMRNTSAVAMRIIGTLNHTD